MQCRRRGTTLARLSWLPAVAPVVPQRALFPRSRRSCHNPPRSPPPNSINSASTRSARCRWTPCRRPTPAIPARRWRWRRSPITLWQNHLRYDPDEPLWPNRDRFVLSVGHASMLLYSLLHLAGVKAVDDARQADRHARRLARRHQAVPPARQQDAGPPRIPHDHRRRDDDRPARPGAAAIASAWRWPRAGSRRTSTSPTAQLFDYRVYALCGDGDMMEGVVARGGVARRASEALEPDAGSTTATASRSKATPTSPSATTWQARFRGYGWNTLHVDDANDAAALEAAIDEAQGDHRPADADRRRRASSAGARRTSRTRPRRTARRSARKKSSSTKKAYGWPEDAQFLVPDGVRERFARGIGARGKAARERMGSDVRRTTARSTRELAQANSAQMRSARIARGLGQRTSRRSRPTRRASPRATRRARCSTRSPQRVPWLIGGAADLVAVDQDQSEVRRRRQLRARQLWRPQPALRHPRTRHGRDRQRHGAVGPAAVRLDVPDFQRLHAAADPPLGDHGSAGRSTCSRTIRSASAKTARRTSRSSSWRRCVACRA